MRKVILISAVCAAAGVITSGGPGVCRVYHDTVIVSDVTPDGDCYAVTGVFSDGHAAAWYDDGDDIQIGDVYSLIMDNSGTESVLDDVIIDAIFVK